MNKQPEEIKKEESPQTNKQDACETCAAGILPALHTKAMSKQNDENKKKHNQNLDNQNNCKTSYLLKPHLLTGYHNRGNLPHIKVEGATYWVTFRLHDSLPQKILRKLEEEKKKWEKEQSSKKISKKILINQWNALYWKRIQPYLDAGMGACWLKRDDIGEMVANALHFFEGKRYELHAWVIMPNHIHVMVRPWDSWTLSSILHSWKSYTGTEANCILEREGEPFWQIESYDHLVRNEKAFYRIWEYTINNPVKAGLCARPEDWKLSSAYTEKS